MFANVNGIRLFYDVSGLQFVPEGSIMRERPVCIVMHGGPCSDHSTMLPDLTPISEFMQLIYVDDRNCGLSTHGDVTESSVKQNCEDIEALRKHLGLEKIFILGYSYGGIKLLRYIMDYPDSLFGAILGSTVANTEGLSNERLLRNVMKFGSPEQVEMVKNKDSMTISDFMNGIGNLYYGAGKYDPVEEFERNSRVTRNVEAHVYQKNKGDLADFDYLLELRTARVPVLQFCGERDVVCDVNANVAIHEALPYSEFHLIPEASHDLFAHYQDQIFPLIKDFVGRHFVPGQYKNAL